MPRRIEEHVKEQVVKMTTAGHTQKEISKMLGISTMSVSRIQKERNAVPPDAKGGWVAKRVICPKAEEPEETRESFTLVSNRTIELVGVMTGFKYTGSVKNKDLQIETGYGDVFVIDIKDLANFSNELLDVAIALEKMRKNVEV